MEEISIKKNWIFNVLNRLVSYIIPLVLTPYVSRIFGAEGVGINSYTTANVTYFTLFSMLGIAGYGRREVAIHRDSKDETSRIFWELTVLHGIFSAFVLAGYFVVILLSDKYRVYYIVNLITVIAAVVDINWFYEAYERFKFISIRNCVLKFLVLICTFAFVHTKDDLVIYIGINAMSTLIANIALFLGLKKYIYFVPLKYLKFCRHIKEVLVYFVPMIASSVYSILDKSVINWVTGSDAENGYYEQAYKIILVVNAIVHSLETVSAPRMSHLFVSGSEQEFKNRLNYSLKIMLLVAMPCAFGLAGIAPNLVPVFLGLGYNKVVGILYVFAPLILILGFSVYLDGLYLVPSGQRGKSALVVCAGATLNLFLNIIFVIKLGAMGAAIATLLTEMFITCIMAYLSRKIIDWHVIFTAILKYGLSGLIMFICIYFIGNIEISSAGKLMVQLMSGICIYGILLCIQKDSIVKEFVRSFFFHNKFVTKK